MFTHTKPKHRYILLFGVILVLCLMFCGCSSTQNNTDGVGSSVYKNGTEKVDIYSDNTPSDPYNITIKPDVMPRFSTLLFHEISDESIPGVNTLTKGNFEDILRYLSDDGFYFLSSKEVYDFLTKKEPIPRKSIWITFDDGMKNSHLIGTELLKKYNAKATAFVEIMQIGTPQRLSENDLKEMVTSNVWDVQSHGFVGHNTSIQGLSGDGKNFYFNKLLIGNIYETDDDYSERIKKDIKKSFEFLKENLQSKKYFFTYPINSEALEKLNMIKTINACLDDLDVIGIGVKGSESINTDWSNFKHCYSRLGVTNGIKPNYISSLINAGKQIYVYADRTNNDSSSDKNLDNSKDTSLNILTNVVHFKGKQYIAWNSEGDFALLDKDMKPENGVFKILVPGKGDDPSLKGKISAAIESGSSDIWMSSWDDRKLYKLSENFSVISEYPLNINPSAIWFNKDKLYILDSIGSVYSFDGNAERIEFNPGYNINCVGGSSNKNIIYVSDRINKQIYKVDYINRAIIGSKKYPDTMTITPHISINEDEFIANEATNNELIRVRY